MPLQVDSTVNYATGKSDIRVAIKDLQIDSAYNPTKLVQCLV
jgi:cell division protein YceG involved in septum cleavage